MTLVRALSRWVPFVALLVTSTFAMPGCVHSESQSTVTQATAVLDDAITKLQNDSSAWRAVLEEAINELPEETPSTIRNEVQNLLTRTISAAGEQFSCRVDFLGDRVLDNLRRIRASITGAELEIEPKFCDFTPPAIDMRSVPNVLNISGYDFDARPPLNVLLVNRNGTRLDVTQHLARQTHYHMTVNLSADGVPLGADSDALAFQWKGGDAAYVQVTQPQLPACETDIVSIVPQARTYRPPHTGQGDKEFFGKVDVWAKVTLFVSPQSVDGELKVTATQYDDDHSSAEGTSPRFEIYRAAPGQRIVQVIGPLEDPPLSYRDTTWEDDEFDDDGGVVKKWIARGDHYGEDAGTWAQATAHFNAIQVEVVQTVNCR